MALEATETGDERARPPFVEEDESDIVEGEGPRMEEERQRQASTGSSSLLKPMTSSPAPSRSALERFVVRNKLGNN